jgi:hypothetical protein
MIGLAMCSGWSTFLRDRLLHAFSGYTFFVTDNQNITVTLPRELLMRAKRLAAVRDTSVSALMAEALGRLTEEDRRYSSARKRAQAALRSPRSLGTEGCLTGSRDGLHER